MIKRNMEYYQNTQDVPILQTTEEQEVDSVNLYEAEMQYYRNIQDGSIFQAILNQGIGFEKLSESEIAEYELTKLKKARARKFEEISNAYYANLEVCLINVTFNGRTEYLELNNKAGGLAGMRQALQKIKEDVTFSVEADAILPSKYQGIERMYYIYVTEFSRLGKMDVIIMKQSKKQALINFWEEAMQKYEGTYEGGEIEAYTNFFNFREYKESLDTLTTIEEIQNFSSGFTPLTLTFPEDCIEDVIYNDNLYDFS